MKIVSDTYAVFWSRAGWKSQHHADVPKAIASSAVEAAAWFKSIFPDDIVYSVRDSDGRFQSFKQ